MITIPGLNIIGGGGLPTFDYEIDTRNSPGAATDDIYVKEIEERENGVLVKKESIAFKVLEKINDKQFKVVVLDGASNWEVFDKYGDGVNTYRVGNYSNDDRMGFVKIEDTKNGEGGVYLYDGINSYWQYRSAKPKGLFGKIPENFDTQFPTFKGYGVTTEKFLFKTDPNNYILGDGSQIDISANKFKLETNQLKINSEEEFISIGQVEDFLLGDGIFFGKAGNDYVGRIGKAGAQRFEYDAETIHIYDNDGEEVFKVGGSESTFGRVKVTDTILIGAEGNIKIEGAGIGGTGWVADVNGIRAYDSVLGEVFTLPTDGSKPTFSAGVIKETEFELYTSSVIRTSENVGNGEAGVLINNSGVYVAAADQTLANANFKATSNGLVSVRGELHMESGSTLSWNNLVDPPELYDDTKALNAWKQSGYATYIDANGVYTKKITINDLDFTPVDSTNVVASINATQEGIKIAADLVELENLDVAGNLTGKTIESVSILTSSFAADDGVNGVNISGGSVSIGVGGKYASGGLSVLGGGGSVSLSAIVDQGTMTGASLSATTYLSLSSAGTSIDGMSIVNEINNIKQRLTNAGIP